VFIEEFEGVENDERKEAEANAFAANTLIPSDFINEIDLDHIDETTIRKVARQHKTHPAIVLGRLQNLDLVPKSFCNHLKLKVILDYVIK
jgi:Zn-dependent peptidase ImmA (M78 family)